MLLRQMKYFVAIADCVSFTEAAEQCYISQPAISQQMAALGAELGVKLFARKAFWQTKRTNYYIEEFADLLRQQFAG